MRRRTHAVASARGAATALNPAYDATERWAELGDGATLRHVDVLLCSDVEAKAISRASSVEAAAGALGVTASTTVHSSSMATGAYY